MKKLFVYLSMMAVAAIMAVNLTSCGEEEDPVPAPTVRLLADIDPEDQYTVMLTVETTDETSISWDYGDGNVSVGGYNHTYTYDASGDYTVTVTVTNETGTAAATADVTINPSIEEMLAGTDAAGKTWVMSTAPSANDGAGPIAVDAFEITLPFQLVGDALAFVGFPDEYDNAFTFKPDGSFSIDNGNGQNLCTQIYAMMTTGEMEPGGSWTKGDLGFATMAYSAAADAAWSVDEDATIALEVMSDDPNTASEYTPLSVSYEGVTQVSITGGYFGILDITNNVIIENITPDMMQIVILMHTEIPDKQSIFARITLIPQS